VPLLSAVLGMTGVWLAVPATELLCALLIGCFLRKK
jgi:Na+-driven multidrug efflux pump